MPAVRIAVVALALVMCACEDAPPDRDLSVHVEDMVTPPDLLRHDMGDELDAGDPPDLANSAGVHGTPCGGDVCFNEADQYCFTLDYGKIGSCEMPVGPGPNYFACDGPEDCSSGACCFLINASVCGAFGFCVAGMTVGEFMCHTDVECGMQSKCCRKSSFGPYATCVDGLAPGDPCPFVP
jgi:hypothetical protein